MTLEIVIVAILIILLVALFAVSAVKKKNFNANLNNMRNDLKNGDKVMTDSGIVGEVVDSFVEDEYKYFVLKSGKGEHVGYYTVHGNAIYYVFGKDEAKKQDKIVLKVAPKQSTESVENKEENK